MRDIFLYLRLLVCDLIFFGGVGMGGGGAMCKNDLYNVLSSSAVLSTFDF